MGSPMPLAGSHERPASRPDVSSQRRKPLVDRASRPQGQNGSSANPPPSRGRGAHNDSDSSDSSDSVTSKDRRARHVRQTRPKTARAAKARAHVGTESASSSNTDSLLPTLGRLLQGRPGQEPNTRLTTSSTGSRSNQRPHQRHASTRSGRIARHHHQTTQAEIQTKLRSLVSPSLQSVLSSLTATTSSSSGSNGSTSTVTQSSYTKSEVSKETVTSTEHRDERLQSTAKKRRQLRDGSSEQPNVFAFMEEDSTHNARVLPSQPSSESDDDGPSRPQTPAIRAHRSSADPFVSPKPQQPIRVASWQSQDQLHSDSGISVRGSSPESIGRRKSIRQAGFEQTSQDMQTKTEGFTAAAQEHIRAAASWQRRWSNASVASQNPSTDLHQQVSGSQPAAIMPYAAPPPAYPGQLIYPEHGSIASPGERKASGYDLLASRLSEPQREGQINISSLYRRFSRLNHRILLHLQDEIAEMEEQLQSLDQSIAHTKPSPSSPESRRSEARYHSDLTYQRTELLGRIFMKIKQYNEAIASYNGATANSEPAAQEDVNRYRDFVRKLHPIVPAELRFLERSDDLVRLFASPKEPPISGAQPPPPLRHVPTMPSLILGPLAAILVAFVMFSAAATALVRALLFVLFSGAGFGALHYGKWGQGAMAEQERQMCLGFCICLLACIAATAG